MEVAICVKIVSSRYERRQTCVIDVVVIIQAQENKIVVQYDEEDESREYEPPGSYQFL